MSIQKGKPEKPGKPTIEKSKAINFGNRPIGDVDLSKTKFAGMNMYKRFVRDDHVQDALDMGFQFVEEQVDSNLDVGELGNTYTGRDGLDAKRIAYHAGKGKKQYLMVCPMEDHVERQEARLREADRKDDPNNEKTGSVSVVRTRTR